MYTTQTVIETLLNPAPAAGAQIARGLVLAVGEDGSVVVACPEAGREAIPCALLQTAEGRPLRLARGDTVLVWQASPDDPYAIILGRVGPPQVAPVPHPAAESAPDEIVIEAKQQLTLKCGEGSITLRGDGKVLIKGKDLVSHAQRMNRVKGGAVAIN
jgi:hypothetical protein